MKRLVTCPRTAHLAEIEYHENPIDGSILCIESCDHFVPADDITCDMLCLRRLNKRLTGEYGIVAELVDADPASGSGDKD